MSTPSPPAGGPRKRRLFRTALRSVFFLCCCGAAIFVINKTWDAYRRIPKYESLKQIPYNDMTKVAVELKVAQSNHLFDLGLVLLGALWALVIAKKDEVGITLGDWPEVITFCIASLLLLLSFVCHESYLDNLSDAHLLGAMTSLPGKVMVPDVSDPLVTYLLENQIGLLVGGSFIAVATIFSAHHLKD
jgi:hypothetical protein